jgi:hypothetical protein
MSAKADRSNREGTRKLAYIRSYRQWCIGANFGVESRTDWLHPGMIFMANRLLNVMCLAALVVFPAHSENLRALFEPGVVAITTYLEPITEDDADQRTKLDLLLAQKQVSREDAINEVSIDLFGIARGEIAGLLSEDLVDKAFADMCSRRGVAPSDLMKTLEEKGIRLDTLRKHLRAEVARERLARMQCRRDCEDRLDYPLVPKM